MFDIVRNNNATFYNYRTGTPRRRWPGVVSTLVGALCLTIPFHGELNGFLESVATAQSILVGFSFNVMFFLVSSKHVAAPIDSSSLEKKLKHEKLKKLGDELFYNVSYFNFIAIACVLVSVTLLLPSPTLDTVKAIISAQLSPEIMGSLAGIWKAVRTATVITLVFLFYFLMLESFQTFYRTAVRVSFFFGEKLKYDASNISSPA
jgi:hypothetical protein